MKAIWPNLEWEMNLPSIFVQSQPKFTKFTLTKKLKWWCSFCKSVTYYRVSMKSTDKIWHPCQISWRMSNLGKLRVSKLEDYSSLHKCPT